MIWVNWITEGRIQWLVRITVNEAGKYWKDKNLSYSAEKNHL